MDMITLISCPNLIYYHLCFESHYFSILEGLTVKLVMFGVTKAKIVTFRRGKNNKETVLDRKINK